MMIPNRRPRLSAHMLLESNEARVARIRSTIEYAIEASRNVPLTLDKSTSCEVVTYWRGIANPIRRRGFMWPHEITVERDDTSVTLDIRNSRRRGIRIDEPFLFNRSNIPTSRTVEQKLQATLQRLHGLTQRPSYSRSKALGHKEKLRIQQARALVTAMIKQHPEFAHAERWELSLHPRTQYNPGPLGWINSLKVMLPNGIYKAKLTRPARDTVSALFPPYLVFCDEAVLYNEHDVGFCLEHHKKSISGMANLNLIDEMKALSCISHIEPPYFRPDPARF